MAPVTISGARKYYGNYEALKSISFEIADGEFVVLVGPSGCGKSTLLRMIAGLEDISDGDILIGDKVVNDLAPKERDIAMVFQSYALYPHMTVRDNMAFSLKLQGIPKPEIDAKVKRAADILGLDVLLDRLPKQLSGGQRQRVAMGRAIVRDPQVFLFDEPLSNLDAKLRVQMRAEIKELHQRLGTTTIYVTHDQVEAMTMADKIVVMRDGYIEQSGSPLDLYDRPVNTFVAGFIGSPSMNFINCSLQNGEYRTPDGITLPRTPQMMDVATYGIRPEHLALSEQGLEIKLSVIEPMGSETHVVGKLGNQPIAGVFRERITQAPGSSIIVAPNPDLVHLFDAHGARMN